MSHNKNTILKEVIAEQLQKYDKQIKSNSPTPLLKTGEETIITNIPSEGFLINKPGIYVFGDTINWSPKSILATAITISCNNVTLNLNENQLIAKGEYKDYSFGIKVINGHIPVKNTKIENGTISQMGFCGISAVKANDLTINQITVKGLSYPSFDLLPSGVFIDQCNFFKINNCNVEEVSVTAALAAGFLVMNSVQGSLYNCTVNNFSNHDGVAGGFVYDGSSYINTSFCTAKTMQTFYGGNPFSKIGHTCIGFMPTGSSNLFFTQCTADDIKGCCDDCHGMSLFNVNTVTVMGFNASNIIDGLGPQKTGAKATGLEVYGDNINILNSTVNNILAIVPQNKQSTGFSACGTLIKFTNCKASKVQVLNREEQPDIQLGYGTGFGWAPDPRPQFVKPAAYVTYDHCIADHCQLGFDTWNHQNSTWIHPKHSHCGKNHLIQPNGTERIYTMNFCSELPNAKPSSPSKQFPIYNSADNNSYPSN